jgi:hypothetical protein
MNFETELTQNVVPLGIAAWVFFGPGNHALQK